MVPNLLTVPLAHPLPDPLTAQLSLPAAEYKLQASEGVHHGYEDHHEQVGSEL